MWLTIAWMALAGLAALAVAVRSRQLRWAVLGAYAVTAALAGAFLGSSVVFDDIVDEPVAMAPARAVTDAAPRNVRLRSGRFESVRHPAAGVATVIRLARGGRVLTLTGFEVDNGPDLRLYLVAGPAREEGEVRDFLDLGRHATVVVWCRAFSVLFARAPLR